VNVKVAWIAYPLSALASVEIHELQHLLDGLAVAAGGERLPRADLEFRAELRGLRAAPPLARHRRLELLATGGDKSTSNNPYEIANFELLEGFIVALYNNPEVGVSIDRERNYQAQLHLFDTQDIRQLAGLVWEARFGED
jgi:hypothetical protein